MVGRGRSGTSPGGRDPRPRSRPSETSTRLRDKPVTADRGGLVDGTVVPSAESETVIAGRGLGALRNSGKAFAERTYFGLSTGRAVLLAIVICALALTLAVPLRTYFSQRSDLEQTLGERQGLENDVAALQAQKDQLNDPANITAQARERLRFVMPGETPYQVQFPGAGAAPAEDPAVAKAKAGPWYSALWNSAVQPQKTVSPVPGSVPPAAVPPVAVPPVAVPPVAVPPAESPAG